MKKTKVIYLIIGLAVSALFLSAGMAWAELKATKFSMVGSVATVDGFAGVPWGANKQQVAEVMAQKGFTLLNQIKDHHEPEKESFLYHGTFIDKPADLLFTLGKNGFISGEADLLDYRQQNSGALGYVLRGFNSINELFVMKYGPPDREGRGARGQTYTSEWTNLRGGRNTNASGNIYIWGGYIRRMTTLLRDQGEVFPLGVTVTYSVEIVSDPY